jgi:putative endonuclease
MGRVPPRTDHARRRPARPEVGAAGERLAGLHLERLGFAVLERNFRTRGGEIDLIAFDGRTLVFAEVKATCTRAPPPAPGRGPTPLERLSPRQRGRLRRVAAAWLLERRPRPRVESIRLDAFGIILDPGLRLLRLDHVEGAW